MRPHPDRSADVEALHDYADDDGRLSWCNSCDVEHARPIGRDWHIEGDDVDAMLCGLRISLDDGEVRDRAPKTVCRRCSNACRGRRHVTAE